MLWPTTFTSFGWVVFQAPSYGRSAIHGATALRRPQSQAAGLALGVQMLDLEYFNMCKHLGYTCAHTIYIYMYITIVIIHTVVTLTIIVIIVVISKWHCRLVSQSSLPSWSLGLKHQQDPRRFWGDISTTQRPVWVVKSLFLMNIISILGGKILDFDGSVFKLISTCLYD